MFNAQSESDLLLPQDWSFPVPVSYGPGRLQEMGQICRRAGIANPLIVTDRGSRDLAFIADLRRILQQSSLTSALFCDVSPNPLDTEIGAGRAMFREGSHDAIIAIGGGSGMDAGKAVCLTATNDIDLWDFEYEQPSPDVSGDTPFAPLICIPTTAGTGAETCSTAMVTDTAKGMKLCVWHPDLEPMLALLDPEITLGLPRNLTAWTGADALTHAIEAYSVPGFHPMCDGIALEGLRLIVRWLPVVAAEPDNLAARGGMLVGSCLAGVSFLKGLGLVHAISHMIGAEFDTQHGLTNAIVLPEVMRFNAPGLKEKMPILAQTMGLSTHTDAAVIGEVCRLLDLLEIPTSLKDIGVPEDCADRIAAKALLDSAAGTNPRSADHAQVVGLIQTVLHRAR